MITWKSKIPPAVGTEIRAPLSSLNYSSTTNKSELVVCFLTMVKQNLGTGDNITPTPLTTGFTPSTF